jgi:hypothetical protein
MSKKLDYKFLNIEIVDLDSLVEESEVSGTLLKAYARIALEGDGGGDGGGITGCDSPDIC